MPPDSLPSISSPFILPRKILEERLLSYLHHDLDWGDQSQVIIPPDAEAKAKIVSKANGILAGGEEARILFESQKLSVISMFRDGEPIKKNQEIMIISGNLREILMIERTALDILIIMSSIASSTKDLKQKVSEVSPKTILAGTRKTTPGFGFFEKKALFLGGGDPHRNNLSDMIMFKDTHLEYFNHQISKMLLQARSQASFSKKIEIEVENREDFIQAIEGKADIIMLDNFKPSDAADLIIEGRKRGKSAEIQHVPLFELSGDITPENIAIFARAYPDIISTSAMMLRPHIYTSFSLKLFN